MKLHFGMHLLACWIIMQCCVSHAVKVLTLDQNWNFKSHEKKIPLHCLPDFKKVPYIKKSRQIFR